VKIGGGDISAAFVCPREDVSVRRISGEMTVSKDISKKEDFHGREKDSFGYSPYVRGRESLIPNGKYYPDILYIGWNS